MNPHTLQKMINKHMYIPTPSVLQALKYPAQALGPERVGPQETVLHEALQKDAEITSFFSLAIVLYYICEISFIVVFPTHPTSQLLPSADNLYVET